MDVAEASGGYLDALRPHVDVPGDLTLLAGQALAGHGLHISCWTFPYIPGHDEPLGSTWSRMSNVVHGVKHLLPERQMNYWPENSLADVSKEWLSSHVLVGEPQAGTDM